MAVDMESGVIAARAARSGYQALVVRAVSDDAGQCLPPELARLVTPEGRLRFAARAGPGCHAPGDAAWRIRAEATDPPGSPRRRANAGSDDRLERMDALVTGGTGFIGANLVRELLASGVRVFGFSRARAEIGGASRGARSRWWKAICWIRPRSAAPCAECGTSIMSPPIIGSGRPIPARSTGPTSTGRGTSWRRPWRQGPRASSTRRRSAPWAFLEAARRATRRRRYRSTTWWARTRPRSSWPSALPRSWPRAGLRSSSSTPRRLSVLWTSSRRRPGRWSWIFSRAGWWPRSIRV